jgi:DNA polymerase elongation subunit (family B)
MGNKLELHEVVAKYKQLANELGRQPTNRDFSKIISHRQICKFGFNEIVKAAGFIPREKNSVKSHSVEYPKILYFDIEISPMWVKTYSLRTDYISHKNIKREWYLYSYAGFFEGEKDKPYYLDNRYAADITDDRQLVEGLHDLLSKADCLVGHNIDKFDLKKFNARAVKYGLPPLTPKKTYDTLKIARKYFAFNSNSLDYIANYLELKERKSGHSKFPGDSLWEGLEAGDLEAWNECQLYNLQDCRVTQELFKRLATYDPSISVQAHTMIRSCICGNTEFRKDGFKYTKSGKFQVYRCKSCSKVFSDKYNLIEKDLRKMLFS